MMALEETGRTPDEAIAAGLTKLGKRGQTLEALQVLVERILDRQVDKRTRVELARRLVIAPVAVEACGKQDLACKHNRLHPPL